jgi:energy-coupling factor transporter ATP-binding protein EcfA2
MQIGSSFVSTWDSWKNGGSVVQANSIERVTEDLRSVFSFEKFEINASSDRKEVRVNINGKPYRLAELGSGLAQFIIIFGNAAILNPPVIFIDEPEINLHPSLQIAFLMALARYADGNIVFATHSIGLARATAEAVYSFRLDVARLPVVSEFEQTPNYAEFVGEMSFSAFKELGVDSLLLVEGVTDVKTFQQFLRKLKKDASVVVIPLGGGSMVCGGREIELEEILRITPKVFAIVDSEREGKGLPPLQARDDFRGSCEKLGIDVHLIARRATENYFTDKAVKAVLGDGASALGEFESLKESSQQWGKSQHNWQIASRMTREDIQKTDVGLFLSKLFDSTSAISKG